MISFLMGLLTAAFFQYLAHPEDFNLMMLWAAFVFGVIFGVALFWSSAAVDSNDPADDIG